MGGSWGTTGVIVFGPSLTSGLFTVPEAGGTPRRLTSMDFSAGDNVHRWPQVLGSSNDVLFTVHSWSRESSAIAIVNIATGKRRIVQQDAAFARYAPAAPGSPTGHIVFVRDGALMAAALDPSDGKAAGTPVTVLSGVTHAQFDISASGVLAYTPGSGHEPVFSLVWVDRAGVSRSINELPRGYEDLGLSPDGRLVALTVEEAGADVPAHVWLADTQRATLTRLTFDGYSRDPVWAPDGQSIVFGSKRGTDTFGLFRQRLDGRSAELLWASPIPIWPDPQSWTPDGKTIVFVTKGNETSEDLWTLSVETGEAKPWLQTVANEWGARVSPDGRWIAYISNESGRDEVYVQPFPGPGAKRLVSEVGGTNPLWSRNGRELFFRNAGEFLVAAVETAGGFTSGKPAAMFSGRYRLTGRDYDVSADGTRFVMMRNDDPRTTTTINVLLNWRKALAKRLNGTPQ
jgi:eukaryotic-like serine/threonine-protein kinase